jgi:hypothetical protein
MLVVKIKMCLIIGIFNLSITVLNSTFYVYIIVCEDSLKFHTPLLDWQNKFDLKVASAKSYTSIFSACLIQLYRTSSFIK